MRLLVPWLLLCLLVGCDRGDPVAVGPKASADAANVSVSFDPPSEASAVPPVVRVVVHPPSPVLPEEVAVATGLLGKAHLRELAKAQPSEALRKRLVPITAFARGHDVVVAPEVALEVGPHTLAIGRLGFMLAFEVRALGGDERLLARTWPTHEHTGDPAALVYCGDALPDDEVSATLEPGGPKGAFVRGVSLGIGRRCVRFRPAPGVNNTGPWVPPSVLGPGIFLDPSPLVFASGPPPVVEPVVCREGEMALGPSCARVEDDRVTVRSSTSPLLWALRAPGVDEVRAIGAGGTFVVKGLSPASSVSVDAAYLSAEGLEGAESVAVTTLTARSHVVLNEVMANPLGPEPRQEWIELTNDGSVVAELGGLTLEDLGGVVVLPTFTLAPGGFALVVPQDFVVDDGLDPAVPEDVALLRVPKLGKSGLGNTGEPVTLRDADGQIVSAFPPSPKPKPGVSVVRRSPEAPDDAPESFALSDGGASPGRPNHPVPP